MDGFWQMISAMSFGERQENSLDHMAVVPKATGAFEYCACKMGSVTKPCQPHRFTRCLSKTDHVTSQRSMLVENNCIAQTKVQNTG